MRQIRRRFNEEKVTVLESIAAGVHGILHELRMMNLRTQNRDRHKFEARTAPPGGRVDEPAKVPDPEEAPPISSYEEWP